MTKEIVLLSDKVARLRGSLLQSEPMLCTERLRFLRDSYRETGGEAPVIRRARLFGKG